MLVKTDPPSFGRHGQHVFVSRIFFLIIYLFLFLVSLGLHCCSPAFSSCSKQRQLFVAMFGLLIVGASVFGEHPWALGHTGFSSCGTWAQYMWLPGSREEAQQLWRTGLVVPWHVESSWTRDWTHVPNTGKRILNLLYHWGSPVSGISNPVSKLGPEHLFSTYLFSTCPHHWVLGIWRWTRSAPQCRAFTSML